MLGGDITVQSAVSQGSTFTIRLPATVVHPKMLLAVPEGGAAASFAPLPDEAPTVLVIDDDPTVHDLLQRFLAKEGFRTVATADGQEGLRLAKTLRPVVIILDVMMPGMDGWTVLVALKADASLMDIPVVMLTIVDDKNMGYALGAADYLVKPIDWSRMTAILQKYRCAQPPCPVLVVEDDDALRELLKRMLIKAGWVVSEAINGREALAHVQVSRPELILLDLMLPEIDGFAFLSTLRQHDAWRTIPVVVLTGKELTEQDRLQLHNNVTIILQKGAYRHQELLHAVRHAVTVCMQPGDREEASS
jgi:DNA-binding response OmpR family regulator